MQLLTLYLVLGFACAAIAMAFSRAAVFESIRTRYGGSAFGRMLHCPFCVSFWASVFFSIVARVDMPWWQPVDVIVQIFSVWGIAALLCGMLDHFFMWNEHLIEKLRGDNAHHISVIKELLEKLNAPRES